MKAGNMSAQRIILSYPFSAALYAFFADDMSREGPGQGPATVRHPHPYYRTLFGDRYPNYQDMALALTIIFDEIQLPPADTYLPAESDGEGVYRNKELGLAVRFDHSDDFFREAEEFVRKQLEDPGVSKILRKLPEHAKRQVLRACHFELDAAEMGGCPIVCGEGRRALLEHLVLKSGRTLKIKEEPSIHVLKEYLTLFVPAFEIGDIETLVSIKQTKSVRIYARKFCQVMDELGTSSNVRRDLSLALLEAWDSAEFSEKLKGYYESASSVFSVAGITPFFGTLASIASLGFTAAAKNKERTASSARWYELVPEIGRHTQLRDLRAKLLLELERD